MIRRTLARWRASTFVRYALSYLSVLALTFAVLIGCLCVYVNRDMRGRALDSQVNRLSRIAFQHEEYLTGMLNTAEQIALSPFIEPFSFDEEPARAYDLLRQLAPYTATNAFCDQMYLHFDGDGYLYSSSSSMTLDMFAGLLQYEHVTGEELLALLCGADTLRVLPAQKVVSRLVDGSESSMVTFIVPLGMSLRKSKGAMMFLLKESVYRDMFADAIESSDNTYIFYGDEVLASSADFDLPAGEVTAALAGMDGERDAEIVSFRSGGEDFNLLALNRRNWGMRYVTVLPERELTGSVLRGLSGLFLVVLLIAALGVALALVMARRSARPIRVLSSMLPSAPQAGDEMASIVTGVRQLAERNTELVSRLESSLPMQRHHFVLRFMKGRFASRAEAVAAAAALGMNIDKPCYAVVLSGAQEGEEQPFDLRKPPLNETPDAVGVGVELVAMNVHLYLIFATDAASIRSTAERIRALELEQSGHAAVALSGIQTDFSRAPSAYLEAATAYDNRFILDESRLLDYGDVSVGIADILPQARKITEGIDQALRLHNRRLLDGKMDELLHFLKHTSMSPFAFRLLYNDVIDALLREHPGAWPPDADPLDVYDIFTLSGCQSVDDLDALLRRLCDAIMRAGGEPDPQQEESSAIDQVIGYMNERFTDPELSISAIAEAFEMSTVRLSLAFKEVTRLSPLEYLTLLRVERSKTLLRQTEQSIKEISRNVGYYDASSFIRRFKQMTGMTPLQYRRSKEEDGA